MNSRIQRRKLLICADDDALRRELEKIFADLDVTFGDTSEQTLTLIRRVEPDVVLFDLGTTREAAAVTKSLELLRQILMGILLLLLFGYLGQSYIVRHWGGGSRSPPTELPPLAGQNTLSGLEVKQSPDGEWIASFDYFYTGAPKYAAIRIELDPQAGSKMGRDNLRETFAAASVRGAHHLSVPIIYPGRAIRTRQVLVKMQTSTENGPVLASQRIDQAIDWPEFGTWAQNQSLAEKTPEENFKHAVALIDSGSDSELHEAKLILERLITRNAHDDAVYIELARAAMKLNWGPEGLHQAESLLASAMQIRPDNANSKILLGYVYAHQRRFKEAEAMFTDAARSNSPNLWLWTNWGELLAMQGKVDQAIVKYREAVSRPMTHDTYDRARADAYIYLLALLDQRKDLDGVEALYKQRLAEFGPGSCYSADYARFMLQVRGDTQRAIDLARGALNQDCEDSESRRILGLAEYVKWSTTTGAQRTEALNQARIFLPAGPMPLYLLATSERTLPAAKQLIASGEAVDQKDNANLTALAHALQRHDLPAAKRLLSLGARPETPVSYENMPVALLPVLEGDIEAIRLLQKYGTNYSKLKYRGATAIDFAQRTGNDALIEALGGKEVTL